MSLTGKVVSVLGAGRSGRAAADLASSKGAEVTIYDSNPKAFCETHRCIGGVTLEQACAVQSDVVIVSPGIDTYGDFVAAFSEQAEEVVGELELAFRYYDGRIVAITGTNGKTTTTEIINAFLNASGWSCLPCGNHGMPLSEVLSQPNVPDCVALEVSSFQLETIQFFRPEIAVWMNFAADHMDRYPDLESYHAAKRRIFENQKADDFAIVRAGEDVGQLAAESVSFSSTAPADYGLAGNLIGLKAGGSLDVSKSRLRGRHNAENVMAAAAVGERFGISAEVMQQALVDYKPPEHRCELIAEIDGVEYVNDSKATNLHALESALVSQNRPVILLAGGKEKGLDYSALPKKLQKHALAVVTFGEINNKLRQIIGKAVKCESVETLEQAVLVAQSLAPEGSMVLLSPGTSSFDQFAGYEERGRAFCDAVAKLSQS